MKVIIEGSGRHIHVSPEDLAKLCGEGFELEVKKALSQPGQFATSTKLDIVGPKGTIKGVSILGPCRKKTQVEVSYTDARILGIAAPVRESGDVAGTPGCTLVGPAGSVDIAEGVIVAKRHIHFTPEDAAKIGVKDKQIVSVSVEGERAGVLCEVVARVSPDYATYMHVDYDEMNGMSIFGKAPMGEVIV